jgi:hypothetical protein
MGAVLDRIDSPEGMFYDPNLVLYLPLHQLDGVEFMDRSHHGHKAVVTGALWTPQGRSFDGVDDTINCGLSTAFFAARGGFGCWVKPLRANPDIYGEAFLLYGNNVNNLLAIVWRSENRLFVINRWGAEAPPFRWNNEANPSDVIPLNEWSHIMLTQDGVAPKLYINGILNRTIAVGNDLTAWTSAATTLRAFRVVYNSAKRYPQCIVSGVVVFNRAVTPLEIQNYYQVTRWRYQ